jgi:hypothetical protein
MNRGLEIALGMIVIAVLAIGIDPQLLKRRP